MDYSSGPYSVTFFAGQTTATFDIQINDDNILEYNENFTLTINSSLSLSTIIIGTSSEATVIIVDDDRKL